MSVTDKGKLEEQDIIESMEEEIQDIQDEEWRIDSEKVQNEIDPQMDKDHTMNLLSKTMADFDNYKKRVERDREDMIFFLKVDILKTVLPRIDDIERMINNTPEEQKTGALYEWVTSTLNKLLKDLEKLWVKSYNSIWEEVDPDLHEVVTMLPWKGDWKIIEEYEKWYTLNWKILRYAKVIVSWNEK